jgi:hypothetical protein
VTPRHVTLGAALALLVALCLAPSSTSSAAPATPSVATWTVKSVDGVDGRYKGQGLATVVQPDGSVTRYFTGDSSVPQFMIDAGWNHNGDPDSAEGYLFEAYQSSNGGATQKLFHVTAPDGTMTDHIHQDLPGEMMNNSFAAVSPDAQWMVSGEWETVSRFLIMPTPILNPSAPGPAADLPVTGQILLSQPVVDIQGCTFQTATRMFCTSDDPVTENGLPRKALLQVDLAHALDGGDVEGTVSLVFALPVPPSDCPIESPGSWPTDIEIEGIDYDRWSGRLAVLILPPRWCALNSRVYNYVSPQGTATHFDVLAPAAAVAGTDVTATLTARDADGGASYHYSGTAHLASSDPDADLPATVTFVHGKATVSATFHTPGAQTISVTDPVVASITGTGAPTVVNAPPTSTTSSTTTPTSTSTSTSSSSTTSSTSTSTTSSTAPVASAPSALAGAAAVPANAGATTVPAASAVASGVLPATGVDPAPLVAAALALLTFGTVLVRRARSRTHARAPD